MLEVTELTAHYGRAQALFGVSFTVGAGELTLLLGRNGAGKSTLLKSLIGLVRPSGGEVRFEGKTLQGRAPWRIARAGLGYVPEERRIFPELTVAENLEVGWRPGTRWTTRRLFALFPPLEGLRDRPGGQLSGGEQQMLSIARTLAGDPRLLLLDEPSEGLAPLVVQTMIKAIASLKQDGVTMLIAEQGAAFATGVADQALVLETGRIAWRGTPSALAADPALQQALLGI